MRKIPLIIAVLVFSGCSHTKPLKGGRATTATKPAGLIEQTVVQSHGRLQGLVDANNNGVDDRLDSATKPEA